MIISFLEQAMLIASIIISLILIIWGYKKEIEYLNPKVPIGRTTYFVATFFSVVCLFSSIYISEHALESSIFATIIYLLVAYSFCTFSIICFWVVGMRRTYDIGLPFWIYPLYWVVVFLSGIISDYVTEFLLLGIWIFVLQPSGR